MVGASSKSNLARYDVHVDTLDNLLRHEERRATFIKVDVEGAELGLLQGAARLIERAKPTWLIEVNDDPDIPTSSGSKVFQLLIAAGYKAYWFDGTTLRERKREERSVNYFFLSS